MDSTNIGQEYSQPLSLTEAIIDSLSAHIAVLDHSGTIVMVNRAWRDFAAQNGALPEAVCEGINYLSICDQASSIGIEGAADFASAIRDVIEGRRSRFEMEYPCHSPLAERWFLGVVTPIHHADPLCVIIAHHDITARRLAEQAEADQRVLAAALRDTAAALNSTLNLNEVFKRVVENVSKVVPHDAVDILLIEGDTISLVGYDGYHNFDIDEMLSSLPIKLKDFPNFSRMQASGSPCVISSTAETTDWIPAPGFEWIKSYCGIPIMLDGACTGFIDAMSATPNFYTSTHGERLRAFADQVAVALRNAHLFHAEQHLRQVEETLRQGAVAVSSSLDLYEVLSRILHHLQDVVRYDKAAILHRDVDTLIVKAVSDRYESSVVGMRINLDKRNPSTEDLLSGSAILIDDIQTSYPGIAHNLRVTDIHATLVIPLRIADRVLGLIAMGRITYDTFKEEDIHPGEALASHAAIAIDNAERYQREREQRAMAQALQEVAAQLSSTLDMNDVLGRIHDQLGKVVPHEAATLMLLEADLAKVVHCWGTHNEYLNDEPLTGLILPYKDIPNLLNIANTRTPMVIPDTGAYPDWHQLQQLNWIKSSLGAPICIDDETVGFITLDSSVRGFFNEAHAEHLMIFTNYLAAAIRNARLFEAQRRERALAQIYQKTAEALTRSSQLSTTLNITMDYLSEVVAFDNAMMLLVEEDALNAVAARGYPQLESSIAQNGYRYVENSLLHRIMQEGEPILLRDTLLESLEGRRLPAFELDTQSWIGVPIVTRDITIGFMSVSSAQPNMYTQNDVDAVKAFTRQTVLAIENSSILAELETSQTNLQQARAHLTRAARLSVAGEIAAGVAHQINNPLTTIIAQTHLLLKRMPPGNKDYNSVKSIKEAAFRAGMVVQRMLDFSKAVPLMMTQINVNESLTVAVSLVRAQIEPHIARIVLDLAPDLPSIQGSSEHLEDVWINLLLNARDALTGTSKGMIRVTTRFLPDEKSLEIVIQDNGDGIPEETIPYVFDPFFTTKQKGTGLGLSICQDVILGHGGVITVHSKRGLGAEFRVILPAQTTDENLNA
jgi:signal transduction histidine kinase